jgi:type II secretory pathway pseudopilin PulG
MNVEQLKALRGPLVLLVMALAAAAGAIYYTQLLRQQAQTALVQQQKQLREAQTRMQRSGDEKSIIVQYVDKYRQLQQSGFIGEERRINWLDALRAANERTDLFGVNYGIEAQQAYPHAAELNPGQIGLRQSVMKLDFRLLHELDLLRFFEALRLENTGLFHLDQCSLRRTEATNVVRYQPNITANCQLAWITATPETTPGGRP